MNLSGRHAKSDSTDARDGDHLRLSFTTPSDGAGVTVTDPIERHQFCLSTPEPVTPEAADPTAFWFPADAAVRVETGQIRLPTVVSVCVRDDDGQMLAQAEHFADESFERGSYSLELFAPIKVYIRVDAPLSISSDAMQTTISFGEETEVLVGARSHHKRPAATITTPDDPREAMRAVSLLGSALKTTTPERSYPTLRGHPPLIERGSSFDAPAGLEAPETGVTLELPPTYRHVYVAAPLAYYLGAEVVPGSTPRLVTDAGFEYSFDSPLGYERAVERVLKQVFFFDCVTRTEGYYEVDLHERRAVEDVVDLDFQRLYHSPLTEQLEAYLGVPYDVVADHVPEWRLTTHVSPTAENVELLSFVANDLAIVRTPSTEPSTSSAVQADVVDEFFRASTPSLPGEEFTRSASQGAAPERSYVKPEQTDSLEQAWVGDGTPVGASKASLQAYRNRLYRDPVEGDIGITVVCNDPRMAAEREAVDSVYGSRQELPFDVRTHYELTVDELHEVFTTETDFLHYIGHIDESGFQCADGTLDAREFDSVATDTFLLNACQSYEQGNHLIDAGAVAGIVTLNDVVNSGAVEIGRVLARLLNAGFPIRSALELARGESVIGNDYIVVGDGALAVTQTDGAFPNSCRVRPLDTGDRFEVTYQTFPTVEYGMGSLVIPFVPGNEQHYLASGVADTFEVSLEDLVEFLGMENIPIEYDNQLFWSSELGVEDF
jgi:hypothetical protein